MSLDGPTKKTYSEEESKLIKHKFITLLYLLLITYLALHQFVIPLMNNLFKGHFFATDIHWTFLIHFYGYYKLEKTKKLSSPFYFFLWTVTALEIVVGVITLGKWGLFSLALTQVSTLVFLYFVFPFVVKDSKIGKSMLAVLIAGIVFLGLQSLQVKSQGLKKATEKKILLHQEEFVISFPGEFPLHSQLSVWNLSNQVISFDKKFKLFNENTSVIDIRLYELKLSPNRLSWKYNRLAQLKPQQAWELPLKDDRIYLIKSPERKDLHVLILIPKDFNFPLGTGDLSVGFNSIEWRGDVTTK